MSCGGDAQHSALWMVNKITELARPQVLVKDAPTRP